MRLIFWVTALAVLSLSVAKNDTSKSKPKRQLDYLRTPQNLQYSLTLPHSRVSHFRSLSGLSRRISNSQSRGGKLPPYAVQMEPVVQYSQKDPLYDPTLDNIDDALVNKNEIVAQPKILNVHDQEALFDPPYGSLPTAPLYSQEQPPQYYDHPHHHYEAPEPIIEIIIKESNESLPAPPPQPIVKKKKEPVQVFYVKYSKDPYSKDKVIYDKPVPAITPPSNDADHHHEDYVTVTPEPYYVPQPTTTLRAIIKPESEIYHTDSNVKITFGSESHHGHYENRREEKPESDDGEEETAPRPSIAFPQQQQIRPPLERSAPTQQFQEPSHTHHRQQPQTYRPIGPGAQHAQSRIQFQQPYLPSEQLLPRQGPAVSNFRGQTPRQNPFGQSPSNPPPFSNFPGPVNHGPNIPGPISQNQFPRQNVAPSFHPRPTPTFVPRPHFNGPPRTPIFHPGPQRPFNQPHPQGQPFFDEAKYLQENYHTIQTEQLEQSKDQPPLSQRPQNFNFVPKPNPNPSPGHFQEQGRPQHIPFNQQLPQQRPAPQFVDTNENKPSFAFASNPNRPSFFNNLKPSPPQIESSQRPFQQSQPIPENQDFSFHQGPGPLSRPAPHEQSEQNHIQNGPSSSSQTLIPQTQFLPQQSSPPLFNFHSQSPSQPPSSVEHQNIYQVNSEAHRPPQQHQDRPNHIQQNERQNQNDFRDPSNFNHQQNVGQFVPDGGQLIPAISKYEQHITISGPNSQTDYSGLGESHQPTPTASTEQRHLVPNSTPNPEQYKPQPTPQQYYDAEQEQVRQQLAHNVQKQQEEIQRLQAQLAQAQQQQRQQANKQYEQTYQQVRNNYNKQNKQSTSPKPKTGHERPKFHSFVTTSPRPRFHYQTTSRTIEIKPTTQKYVSTTANSISTTPEAKKQEKKRPQIELPDEVPDDLRQQLLSSGILDNADISVLDYDKVGDTPLESLPPDQLAHFFSAGGGQQISASEHRATIVNPSGDKIESRIDEEDEDEDDQEIAASENVPTYAVPDQKQDVEMKVVHFDPKSTQGQNIANQYVKNDATQLEPVSLNDKKYNRYLPLKVSGNQFPLPDILKGRKITSVVVLAPVETEALNGDHTRAERATSNSLKGIKFVAGESLQDLLKKPTKENFARWLESEKKTASDLQSVVLLVTEQDEASADREIYMYDVTSGKVNKLSGELSSAFVEAAENNSLSKDIEKLAIEGEGIPEDLYKEDRIAEGSENVPLLVDLSSLSLEQESNNRVSITSGYSKMKHGRSLRKQ